MVYRVKVNRTRIVHAVRNLLLILLISFGLGEAALRVLHRINPSFVFHDASYDRFRARPGSSYYGFPINSRGFHDLEFPTRSADRYRILALGDSFAFGIVPYEHNYLTLLESMLDSSLGAVEVLNMGIPRTGPLDHLALLVNEGLALEPDMVLLSLFVGNDLMETYRELQQGRPLYSRSHVLSLLRVVLLIRPQSEPGVLRSRRTYRDDQPTFGEISHLEILGGNADVYRKGWQGFTPSLDAAVAAITEIADICRARGIALTVLLIPEETQLDEDLQHDLASRFDRYREADMDFLLPNRALTTRLGELGIDLFDLYPAFREGGGEATLYKPRDTHWNIAGNRLAAERISDHLLPIVSGSRSSR